MNILFPSSPFYKSTFDDCFEDELIAAKKCGFSCFYISIDDLFCGKFKVTPDLPKGEKILYRGWMLQKDQYEKLCGYIINAGAIPMVSPEEYILCHHLPNWYPICKDFTIETVVLPEDADFVESLKDVNWPAYFVKDYVKSIDGSGVLSSSPSKELIKDVVSQIKKYRGFIEGGVCVRKFEKIVKGTEERYFVFNGIPYSIDGGWPVVVYAVAKRIKSPFYSVDIAKTEAGNMVVIELGDGQVSDLKNWSAKEFMSILSR